MRVFPILIGAVLGAAAGAVNYLLTRQWMRRSENFRGAFLLFLCHMAMTAVTLAVTWAACHFLEADPLMPFAAEVLVQTVVLILCVLATSRSRRRNYKEA